jgi:hypothetical protein
VANSIGRRCLGSKVARHLGARRRASGWGSQIRRVYRWRIRYGALKEDEAQRLKALEQENARLKRIVVGEPLGQTGGDELAAVI